MTTTIVLLIHVFLAIGLIGLILLQHGKGADAGAAFGSGASATVFGAQGSASFLSRATKWLAIMFFITSGALAWLSSGDQVAVPSLMDGEVPAVSAPVESQPAAIGETADQDLPPVSEPAEESAAEEQAAEGDEPPADDGGR